MATFLPALATLLKATLLLIFIANCVFAARTSPATMPTPTTDVSKTRSSLDEPVQATASHVLAKGQVPPSGPSHKGHSAPSSTRHLLRTSSSSDQNFRMLTSTPSPGVGHWYLPSNHVSASLCENWNAPFQWCILTQKHLLWFNYFMWKGNESITVGFINHHFMLMMTLPFGYKYIIQRISCG